MFISAGWGGSVHDSTAWRSTPLDTYLADVANVIGINGLQAFIVVDGGFRLRRRVMKPYPRGALTEEQAHFNATLSANRAGGKHMGARKPRLRVVALTPARRRAGALQITLQGASARPWNPIRGSEVPRRHRDARNAAQLPAG